MPANDHAEVVRALAPAVARHLALLKPVATVWQPSDCLPDLAADDWPGAVARLREGARALPDAVLIVLVGDAVTEEALPSYAMSLNTLVNDREGTSDAPWARRLRGWTAEENRHGDVLNAYLRLSGRVDMRAVERSVHTLIAAGFAADTGDDPYGLLVYTSFQERATRISHANVGRLAAEAGDESLSRICRLIASDEARHETFYTRMMGEVLDADPAGGVLAFHAMLRRQITMPGRLMGGASEPDLFDRFAAVAQCLGVYTAGDYTAIVEHLVATWDIAGRSVAGEAARAQDELCRMPVRLARLAERMAARSVAPPSTPFGWIRGRHA
jgi:acyl-[acyl-carrier-protein] desaturase